MLEAEFEALTPDTGPRRPGSVSTAISVRLRPDELADVEKAAKSAGLPLSTFIRLAALGAAEPVDLRSISAKADTVAGEVAELAAMLRRGAA